MPDHLHLCCAPATLPPQPLGRWVAFWKRLLALETGEALWQKNFWDTQLRCGDDYAGKWEYIRHNPVRAGLCERPEAWPYQGELNGLRWHR